MNETLTYIDRPTVFVGMGRSGTTLIFEAFTTHGQVGWLSNYCELSPKLLVLNLLCRLLDNDYWSLCGCKVQYGKGLPGNRFLPQPDEAYSFWNYWGTPRFGPSYLLDEQASPEQARRLRWAVRRVLRWQGRQRFSAKMTGPGRLTWLNSVFPGARFVHIVRDGRSVADSLLRVDFWRERGLDRPFWDEPLPQDMQQAWHDSNWDPAVLAAAQWVQVLRSIRQEARTLSPDTDFIELRYEDFVAHPESVLGQLYRYADLPLYTGLMERALGKVPIMDFSSKYQANLGQETVDRITEVMQPELEHYGYL